MTAEEKPIFDVTFPVEVGDGRSLTISWNHGDDAHDVARKFADEHGIFSDEIQVIEAFVHQAADLARRNVQTCADMPTAADETLPPQDAADMGGLKGSVPTGTDETPPQEHKADESLKLQNVEGCDIADGLKESAPTVANEAPPQQHEADEPLKPEGKGCEIVEDLKESMPTAADEEVNPQQHGADEPLKPKDVEDFEMVDGLKQSVQTATNEVPPQERKEDEPLKPKDEDEELVRTATHLAEAGLGDVDVVLQLLKAHGGSVQRTLEDLLSQA